MARTLRTEDVESALAEHRGACERVKACIYCRNGHWPLGETVPQGKAVIHSPGCPEGTSRYSDKSRTHLAEKWERFFGIGFTASGYAELPAGADATSRLGFEQGYVFKQNVVRSVS